MNRNNGRMNLGATGIDTVILKKKYNRKREKMTSLCPYCNKRKKIKKTCGHPECQHKHHYQLQKASFDKFYRKTDRRVSPSIIHVKQQASQLAGRQQWINKKSLCPYCKIRPLIDTKTCGDVNCQYEHHLEYQREYHKKYSKSPCEKKRWLAQYYKKRESRIMKLNFRERIFAAKLTKDGRKWKAQPVGFHFAGVYYRPDFYLPEEDLYIEVVGTKTAYYNNRHKYELFKLHFPNIKFSIVDYIGNSI
jgi:hypothetical protein